MQLEVGAVEESVTVTGASPLVQTSSSELGTTVDGRADQDAAAQRPQLRQPDAHRARRRPRDSRREHRRRRQPGLARVGVVLGERPAAARQQLHARRRRQQRDLAADGRAVSERRRARRVQAADEHLLGGVRPVARRRRQPADQVGRQRHARQRASSSCATTRSTPTTSSTTAPDAPKPEFSQHQFGGTIGGPIVKDKTFYFFDYQGYRVNQGATYLSTVPSAKMRAGDFSELNRVIYDPITHLPFPGNVIPPNRWDPAAKNILDQLIPESNTGGIAQRHRADDQQLPDQPDARTAGQPDRPQGRSHPVVEQPLLRALQLREDAPRPAGDAAARRRRRSPSAPATATSRRRASPSTTRTRSARTG